jgi:hypothetical protein
VSKQVTRETKGGKEVREGHQLQEEEVEEEGGGRREEEQKVECSIS